MRRAFHTTARSPSLMCVPSMPPPHSPSVSPHPMSTPLCLAATVSADAGLPPSAAPTPASYLTSGTAYVPTSSYAPPSATLQQQPPLTTTQSTSGFYPSPQPQPSSYSNYPTTSTLLQYPQYPSSSPSYLASPSHAPSALHNNLHQLDATTYAPRTTDNAAFNISPYATASANTSPPLHTSPHLPRTSTSPSSQTYSFNYEAQYTTAPSPTSYSPSSAAQPTAAYAIAPAPASTTSSYAAPPEVRLVSSPTLISQTKGLWIS